MTILKTSPHGTFKVTQLSENIVICESQKGDPLGWGGDAFITYLGCKKSQVKEYIERLFSIYKVESCEPRKPKYLTDFEVEIKIRGMRKTSSLEGLGLDHLIETEDVDYDEYLYCCGYEMRW